MKINTGKKIDDIHVTLSYRIIELLNFFLQAYTQVLTRLLKSWSVTHMMHMLLK